ncbi:MAG: EamA family transporter [Dehalococcoidia bacterium]|nr:EamA family transporter [Dehalococcoidia bacterium]
MESSGIPDGRKPLTFVIISASLFGVGLPLAKLLLRDIPPVALAGLLYLGAFVGMFLFSMGRKMSRTASHITVAPLERKDLPWLAGAVLTGGVLAPIMMMTGLSLVSGFSASLLSNLEGVATATIAVLIFRENAGRRLWLALVCMTVAGIFLTWDPARGEFTVLGPLLIVSAMVCWGIDNNLTRSIADKDPIQIAKVKSLVGGITSLSIALVLGFRMAPGYAIALALLVGSFSYGMSLVFFIKALQGLGSFRTGALYGLSPFIGAVASLIILREWIGWVMFPATGLMILGVWLVYNERHSHVHLHEAVTHIHLHIHSDPHHLHSHSEAVREPHAHEHTHVEGAHAHVHWPDTHHRHGHPA